VPAAPDFAQTQILFFILQASQYPHGKQRRTKQTLRLANEAWGLRRQSSDTRPIYVIGDSKRSRGTGRPSARGASSLVGTGAGSGRGSRPAGAKARAALCAAMCFNMSVAA
jgi:hypothetical protein